MVIDQFQTALVNGFSVGQAEAIFRMDVGRFTVFLEDMIPRGGLVKTVVFVDGSTKTFKDKVIVEKIVWKVSSYNSNEFWANANDDYNLLALIKQSGNKLVMGNYEYSLSTNMKYFKRKVSTL
jgi:hypothetical protein